MLLQSYLLYLGITVARCGRQTGLADRQEGGKVDKETGWQADSKQASRNTFGEKEMLTGWLISKQMANKQGNKQGSKQVGREASRQASWHSRWASSKESRQSGRQAGRHSIPAFSLPHLFSYTNTPHVHILTLILIHAYTGTYI